MHVRRQEVAHPDHKHGTLDFVGGGSDKLCGDGVHRVVQHSNRRNELRTKHNVSLLSKMFPAAQIHSVIFFPVSKNQSRKFQKMYKLDEGDVLK